MYCQQTNSFSGEVFKENFTDIFYTNLEQIAFSISFPIKNSVKRKTSLFIEKKPKAKISLHIKIGDYLSSGDKIGEKESNIHEAHYVTVASHLRSTYKCFQVQTKAMRLPRCKSMICQKSKMMNMVQIYGLPQGEALRRYAIRLRRSSANALACKSFICKTNKSSIFTPCSCVGEQIQGFVPLATALAEGHHRRFAFVGEQIQGFVPLASANLRFARRFACGTNPWICSPSNPWICSPTQKDLYVHQLRFAGKVVRAKSKQTLCKCKPLVCKKKMDPQSEALRRRTLRSRRSSASMLAYKSKQIGYAIAPTVPRRFAKHTQLDLYGPQFWFARKRDSLLFANRQFTFASPSCKKVTQTQSRCKVKGMSKGQKNIRTPLVLPSSGRVVMISKNQLVLQKTQPVLFYDSANLHVKKGEFVLQGAPLLTLTHQTLITGDIVQGIPRIEQLFEAFTSPQKGLKDKKRLNVHDTLHSQVRDIFRKNWLKNILSVAVRKSLEEIGSILLEMIQKVYLSQGVLISDKHIEIIIRQMTSKGQILDSGSTGLLLEEVLPIRQIENANITTPGKKCLYVPSVVGLTAAALTCDSFISAASFQETTRVLSRDAVGGKTDFLRGLKEKVVIGDLISAGTGLEIYFVYTLFSESISYVRQSKTSSQ